MKAKSGRALKKKVLALLSSDHPEEGLKEISGLPPRQVINPLFSFLLHTSPSIRWAAVSAFGAVVSRLARVDMESARIIMRRLMWQLNDESGGIGWGCPEALGEIMACHEGLAREFARVLVSYIDEQGNFLEYEPLQQGALWGVMRLARSRPERVKEAESHLKAFLSAPDTVPRALALLALGPLGAKGALGAIASLAEDHREVEIYLDGRFRTFRVSDLAGEAVKRIEKTG
jgi:hypothetical protein